MRSLRPSTSARSRAAIVFGGTAAAGVIALLGAPAAGAATAEHSPSYHAPAHVPASHLVSSADHARITHWAGTLRRIRTCEASGNYGENTGNGYYGAYQFAAGTWHLLGYHGLPNQAAPIVQDAAAAKLLTSDGTSPWGACA